MSPVHKLLRGPAAGLYLPFALSKLRFMQMAAKGSSRSQNFKVPGYDINVRQTENQQFISITQSGGNYFEFFTDGNPITMFDDPIAGNYPEVCVVGGNVLAVTNTSTVTTSPRIKKNKRVTDAATVSPIRRPQQINLISEPVAEVRPTNATAGWKPTRFLFESYAPMTSHTGVYATAYTSGRDNAFPESYRQRPSIPAVEQRDVLYDIPWSDMSGITSVREAFPGGDADWPRASGIRTVTDATYGTREFAINIDAFGQWEVFPTSQIKAIDGTNQNVDTKYIKLLKPTLPTWVEQMSIRMRDYWAATGGNTGIGVFPEMDWKLHPDGLRAVAVVYEKQPVAFDSVYYGPPNSTGAPTPLTLTTYKSNVFYDQVFGRANSSAVNDNPIAQVYDRQMFGTGIIEVGLNITLTGKNPDQFDISFTVNEVRRPTTATVCSFLAGYAWYDIKDKNGVLMAHAGDLYTLDIERYYDPSVVPKTFTDLGFSSSQMAASTLALFAPRSGSSKTILSLKNLTLATEMGTFKDNALLDFDLPTMSFVFAHCARAKEIKTLTIKPDVVTPLESTMDWGFEIAHVAAAVYVRGLLVDTLYPDTMTNAAKALVAADLLVNPRSEVAGMTFLPLNDTRDWTASADLIAHRSNNAIASGWFPPGSPVALSSAYKAWFAALTTSQPAYELFMIDKPQFGWYTYSDAIMNINHKTPWSTFWVHPLGSWAFFDYSRYYNPCGIPDQTEVHDYGLWEWNTSAQFDVTRVEHVIFDKIHLVLQVPGKPDCASDTSFITEYNTAAAASSGGDTFNPLSKIDMRATFSSQEFSYKDPSSDFTQFYTLVGVTFLGTLAGFIPEQMYQRETHTGGGTALYDVPPGGGGSMYEPTFFAATYHLDGSGPFFAQQVQQPYRFCSPALFQQ